MERFLSLERVFPILGWGDESDFVSPDNLAWMPRVKEYFKRKYHIDLVDVFDSGYYTTLYFAHGLRMTQVDHQTGVLDPIRFTNINGFYFENKMTKPLN